VDKFLEGILVHFTGVVKEALDGWNSPWRIHEVLRAVRSCRGAGELQQAFSKHSPSQKGLLDHLHNLISWIHELKV
jgi:hypothetical protein